MRFDCYKIVLQEQTLCILIVVSQQEGAQDWF